MGWTKLAVPEEVVAYLAGLDVDGPVVVRTPEAAKRWKESNHDYNIFDFMKGGRGLVIFLAFLGTLQGDVLSLPLWISLFDILMRALETRNEEETRATVEEGEEEFDREVKSAQEQGYIDDLFSAAATWESIQYKADLVSAFSIVFGVSVSDDKLRRMLIIRMVG